LMAAGKIYKQYVSLHAIRRVTSSSTSVVCIGGGGGTRRASGNQTEGTHRSKKRKEGRKEVMNEPMSRLIQVSFLFFVFVIWPHRINPPTESSSKQGNTDTNFNCQSPLANSELFRWWTFAQT
jgi:hypothetical protein